MKTLLALTIAIVLGACSLTSADRTAIRETAVNEFMGRIDLIREVAGNPEGASETTRAVVDVACVALQIGGPFIAEVINRKALEANATLPPENQISPDEFMGAISDLCTAINAFLRPAPVVAPGPVPNPAI